MDNNYDELADSYLATDLKPDKRYSILSTVLSLAGNLNNKTVLDLGCGSGFFTRSLAETAYKVIGLDNSAHQLALAKAQPRPNIEYRKADMMRNDFPIYDVVNAPFVMGYCKNVDALRRLFDRVYQCLNVGGRFIGVVDLLSGEDMKKYGATKILHGRGDGAAIEIILRNGQQHICTLWAVYFSGKTIGKLLKAAGFLDVKWHEPIISQEGIMNMPPGFWKGYNAELGYITAQKS